MKGKSEADIYELLSMYEDSVYFSNDFISNLLFFYGSDHATIVGKIIADKEKEVCFRIVDNASKIENGRYV